MEKILQYCRLFCCLAWIEEGQPSLHEQRRTVAYSLTTFCANNTEQLCPPLNTALLSFSVTGFNRLWVPLRTGGWQTQWWHTEVPVYVVLLGAWPGDEVSLIQGSKCQLLSTEIYSVQQVSQLSTTQRISESSAEQLSVLGDWSDFISFACKRSSQTSWTSRSQQCCRVAKKKDTEITCTDRPYMIHSLIQGRMLLFIILVCN